MAGHTLTGVSHSPAKLLLIGGVIRAGDHNGYEWNNYVRSVRFTGGQSELAMDVLDVDGPAPLGQCLG